jgi:hypothetical protein
MPPSKHPPLRFPIALSRSHPFVTVLLSDLNGPTQRLRLVVRERCLPEWLREHAPLLGPGLDLVVGAMGKARVGSRTRIRSIVVYPARLQAPEFAYVYVEEHEADGRSARTAAPLHVVRCATLPQVVHFVEASAQLLASRPPLKVV